MKPISIKKNAPAELDIVWQDGHRSTYSLEQLRDLCPCAGCKGESILLHEYHAPPVDKTVAGRYDLVGIEQVGSYAIQLGWGDGHRTGIYTWEYLLLHCPCSKHITALSGHTPQG